MRRRRTAATSPTSSSATGRSTSSRPLDSRQHRAALGIRARDPVVVHELASFSRLIRHDSRGTGLSDERAASRIWRRGQDVVAVLDATEIAIARSSSERARAGWSPRSSPRTHPGTGQGAGLGFQARARSVERPAGRRSCVGRTWITLASVGRGHDGARVAFVEGDRIRTPRWTGHADVPRQDAASCRRTGDGGPVQPSCASRTTSGAVLPALRCRCWCSRAEAAHD